MPFTITKVKYLGVNLTTCRKAIFSKFQNAYKIMKKSKLAETYHIHMEMQSTYSSQKKKKT